MPLSISDQYFFIIHYASFIYYEDPGQQQILIGDLGKHDSRLLWSDWWKQNKNRQNIMPYCAGRALQSPPSKQLARASNN